MDNKIKKYLDKVVDYIVRSTEIDYEDKYVIYSHLNPSEEERERTAQMGDNPEINRHYYAISFYALPKTYSYQSFISKPPLPHSSFSEYCKDMFGLTYEEIIYVHHQYTIIMKDKISNRES